MRSNTSKAIARVLGYSDSRTFSRNEIALLDKPAVAPGVIVGATGWSPDSSRAGRAGRARQFSDLAAMGRPTDVKLDCSLCGNDAGAILIPD
jgi:hypothetical protein